MLAMLALTPFLAACGPTETLLELPDTGPPWDGGAGGGADGGTEIPLTLVRALPSHGPFSGGNTVILRGAGFRSSAIEVRFGEITVPASDVRRIDPNRLEVVVPAAAPGAVDVELADGESRALLEDAYAYDAFELDPSSGPPSGRTRLTVRAASALFDASSAISIDGAPCTEATAVSPTELTCRTPAHALGRADVSIAAGTTSVLDDAFLYENPFRSIGGLGGGPLEGTLSVLVRDAGHAPLAGATVVAGREGALVHRGVTGSDGTIVFTGDDLLGPVTVFAWERCHHHTGFVGGDAAYVTVPLELAYVGCTGSGPPTSDGTGSYELSGEAVFYEGREFPSPTFEWVGVPEPGSGEERVMYVSVASARNLSGGSASAWLAQPVRVSESTRGARGFPFALPAAGLGTPLAVAGIESPASGEFVPYVAGLGSPVTTGASGLEIRMDTPIESGREIAVTVPAGVPRLGDVGHHHDEPAREVELDRLRVQARYTIPAVVSGLPVFIDMNGAARDNDVSGALPRVALARQPSVAGSFAFGEQELHVILTTGELDYGWEDTPHTRTLVRPARGTNRVDVADFIDIAGFTAPAELGATLAADHTVRWEVDPAGVTLQLLRVLPNVPGRIWIVFAAPEARALTLPDDLVELAGGLYAVDLTLVDTAGFEFDSFDTRAYQSLGARRTSRNETQFVVVRR